LLGKGETVRTGYCLQRLADVTQEAKDSIRTYLLGVKTVAPGGQALLSTLENYLMHYNRNNGITTDLVVISPELESKRIDATVELIPPLNENCT